jgi:hypothetical protein
MLYRAREEPREVERDLLCRDGTNETIPVPDQRDLELRAAAALRVRELQRRYDDLVPVEALREGFTFRGRRVSFGSFYSGIFRPKEMTGPAALSLVTAAPKEGRPAPYEDAFDDQTGRFTYRFRDPQGPSSAAARGAEADNRALTAVPGTSAFWLLPASPRCCSPDASASSWPAMPTLR